MWKIWELSYYRWCAKNVEYRMLPGEWWDWIPCIWSFWKHPLFKYIQASLSTILLSYLAHPFNNISSINQAVYIFLSNLKRLGGDGLIYPTSYILNTHLFKGSDRLCKVVELSMQCCGKLLSDSFETYRVSHETWQ